MGKFKKFMATSHHPDIASSISQPFGAAEKVPQSISSWHRSLPENTEGKRGMTINDRANGHEAFMWIGWDA